MTEDELQQEYIADQLAGKAVKTVDVINWEKMNAGYIPTWVAAQMPETFEEWKERRLKEAKE